MGTRRSGSEGRVEMWMSLNCRPGGMGVSPVGIMALLRALLIKRARRPFPLIHTYKIAPLIKGLA